MLNVIIVVLRANEEVEGRLGAYTSSATVTRDDEHFQSPVVLHASARRNKSYAPASIFLEKGVVCTLFFLVL